MFSFTPTGRIALAVAQTRHSPHKNEKSTEHTKKIERFSKCANIEDLKQEVIVDGKFAHEFEGEVATFDYSGINLGHDYREKDDDKKAGK